MWQSLHHIIKYNLYVKEKAYSFWIDISQLVLWGQGATAVIHFFWIKLGADVQDLATCHICFSKDHLLFPSRKKSDTI